MKHFIPILITASFLSLTLAALTGCGDFVELDFGSFPQPAGNVTGGQYSWPQSPPPPKTSTMNIDSLEMDEDGNVYLWASFLFTRDTVLFVNFYRISVNELEKVDGENFRVVSIRDAVLFSKDTLDFQQNKFGHFVVEIPVYQIRDSTYYEFIPGGTYSANGSTGDFKGNSLLVYID